MPTLMASKRRQGSRNLEIKPYAISQLTTDRVASPRVSNDLGGNAGGDVKIGLTDGLTADLTYRTDFAQVEADEQQVNLTRFSLFFPEKREFFLENQGAFAFGGNIAGNPAGGGGGGGAAAGERRQRPNRTTRPCCSTAGASGSRRARGADPRGRTPVGALGPLQRRRLINMQSRQ